MPSTSVGAEHRGERRILTRGSRSFAPSCRRPRRRGRALDPHRPLPRMPRGRASIPYRSASRGSKVEARLSSDGKAVTPPAPAATPTGPSRTTSGGMHRPQTPGFSSSIRCGGSGCRPRKAIFSSSDIDCVSEAASAAGWWLFVANGEVPQARTGGDRRVAPTVCDAGPAGATHERRVRAGAARTSGERCCPKSASQARHGSGSRLEHRAIFAGPQRRGPSPCGRRVALGTSSASRAAGPRRHRTRRGARFVTRGERRRMAAAPGPPRGRSPPPDATFDAKCGRRTRRTRASSDPATSRPSVSDAWPPQLVVGHGLARRSDHLGIGAHGDGGVGCPPSGAAIAVATSSGPGAARPPLRRSMPDAPDLASGWYAPGSSRKSRRFMPKLVSIAPAGLSRPGCRSDQPRGGGTRRAPQRELRRRVVPAQRTCGDPRNRGHVDDDARAALTHERKKHLIIRAAPKKFVSKRAAASASGTISTAPSIPKPALFTSTSTGPTSATRSPTGRIAVDVERERPGNPAPRAAWVGEPSRSRRVPAW